MTRKTLTEWPAELPEGRWEYIVDVGITVSGSFVESVNGGLLFESDVTGSQWEASGFTDGETFVLLGADPDPRDARIAALEGEVAGLKGRLRETCQILVESVGGLGPCDAEDAARRAAEVVDQLRAQLAAPLRLPSVEEVSARVHDAWMESKWQAGVTSRKLEGGEELMVSYPDLSEQAKELDRATVRAVYAAIGAAGRPEPAPLRLGRGPTVEEAKAHADAQEDGHGWWLVSFDVKRRPDDEAIYFEIASIEVEDGEVFVDGMSSADGSRYTEITDAIPLNASRQPCGVGVKL